LTTLNSTVLVERLIKDYFKAHYCFNQRVYQVSCNQLKEKWQKLEIKISRHPEYLKEVEALGIATNFFKRVTIQLNGFNQRRNTTEHFKTKVYRSIFAVSPYKVNTAFITCLWLAINDQGLPQVWD